MCWIYFIKGMNDSSSHSVVGLIEEKESNDLCIIFEGGHESASVLTYSDFFKLSTNICTFLKTLKTKEDGNTFIIGHTVTNSCLAPALLYGILKAECAFLSFDNTFDKQLVQNLIDKACISYLITLKEQSETLRDRWKDIFSLNHPSTEFGHHFVVHKLRSNSPNTILPDTNIAYSITTSGTTGIPKLVFVPHSSIYPNILDFSRIYNLKPSDIFFTASPLTFDPSLVDIFTCLHSKATILLISDEIKAIPERISVILKNYRIKGFQCTPSFFLSISSLYNPSSELRLIAVGGERFPSIGFIKIWKSGKNISFINLYGITEVSSWAFANYVNFNDEECDLGQPLSETNYEIKENILYLSSQTRFCYVDNEIKPVFSRCTGDLVEERKGKLFYVGRKDSLVKRNGKRLNLIEIEKCVIKNKNVLFCSAIVSSKDLIVIIKSTESMILEKEVRDSLRHLPPYYSPSKIIILKKLPLTSNGKVDVAACLGLYNKKTSNIRVNEYVETFYKILNEFGFEAEKIDKTHQLAKYGLDSTQAVIISERLQNEMKTELPGLTESILINNLLKTEEYLSDSILGKSNQPSHKIIKLNTDEKKCQCIFTVKAFSFGKSNISYEHSSCDICGNCSSRYLPYSEIPKTFETVIKTLKVDWKVNTGKCIDACPLVVVKDEMELVIIGSHSHKLMAVDIKIGEVLWETKVGDRIEGSACLSPCSNFVLVGCYDCNLYLVNLVTGVIFKKLPTDGLVKCCPTVISKKFFFGCYGGSLYGIEINTGRLKVEKKPLSRGPIYSQISAFGNNLLVLTLRGFLMSINKDSFRINWALQYQQPFFSSPITDQDWIVVANVSGKIVKLDWNKDEKWSLQLPNQIYSSPIKYENLFLIGCNDCCVYGIHFTTGDIIWKYNVDSPVFSSPCLLGNLFAFVSTRGRVYVLDVNGKPNEDFNLVLNGEVFSSIVPLRNKFFIGCRDDNLYSIQLENR